jgi:hypothetical protein|tara:strand:+ start:1301 stop:2194 length:894 start_codon:yes stop_codon:yes gene_type:complete
MDYSSSELHFFGHQTFPLRHLWLPKAAQHVELFGELTDYDRIMEEQGVGKNMAQSMRHWAEATTIVEWDHINKKHSLSTFGKILFSEQGDRYLQYTDTIWLIHYHLVTNHRKNAVLFYLFNVFGSNTFTKESFINRLYTWLEKIERKPLPSRNTIDRDFQCLINMYCEKRSNKTKNIDEFIMSPLVSLQLISFDGQEYKIRQLSSTEISRNVVNYCLLDNLNLKPENAVIPFNDLLNEEKSPGKVFNMTENTLVSYLDYFVKDTAGSFEFETTAGLKTLYRLKPGPKKNTFLKKAFK